MYFTITHVVLHRQNKMNHFSCSWLEHSTHTKPYNKYDLQLGLAVRGETRQLLSRGERNEWEHGYSLIQYRRDWLMRLSYFVSSLNNHYQTI